MYVWEKYLEKAITEARKDEMNILLKLCIVLFTGLVMAILIEYLTLYFLFLTCFWIGITVNAEIMYFFTTAFQAMTFTIGTAFPYTAFVSGQAVAATSRFQTILKSLDAAVVTNSDHEEVEEPKIFFKDVSIHVNDRTTLNVNIDIDKGLSVLLGPTASGKTTFLLTILKEFDIESGTLDVKGRVSYASQEPWLFPSTIKKNIIFGEEFIPRRYQEVIQACALQYDFDLLENGDETVVSDYGYSLSKGQQCRINLARAAYKESDIYLLDDCFSNLDPIVADWIFSKCISQFLKTKIIILVTNNYDLVKYADNVITINNGFVTSSKNSQLIKKKECVGGDTLILNTVHESEGDDDEKDKLMGGFKNHVYEETKKRGSVSTSVYKEYVEFGGSKVFGVVVVLLFVFGQLLISYKDFLISDWANLEEKISHYGPNNTMKLQELREHRSFILYVYTIVIIGMSLMILGRAYGLFVFSKTISLNLHQKMLNSVINATMTFFDDNFIGNIVNRFSKDLLNVDEGIPFVLLHLMVLVFQIIGIIFLICFVNATFLIPTVFLLTFLIILRRVYLKIGRALKRLDAAAKSPIVGHLNSVLKGLPTIKAFGTQKLLSEEFDVRLDIYNSASYSNVTCMKAFVFAADLLTSTFISIVILKFVIFDQGATSGDVGLAISQAFLMGSNLHFGIYKWADLEIQMTSVERAVECIHVPQEFKTGLVLTGWPNLGQIKFENVYLSFKNCKSYVLENVNFTVNAGEKIGVVGRTGSGKSSLISAFFRLYDVEGKISIDGVDIKTLSLDCLRSNISVIPQNPLVLNGSLRDNMDPENKYKDEEIWNAIDCVQLRGLFPCLEIDIVSSELSFVNKQLLNLARILMQKSRIVVFDEIIENGDSETETLICNIISRYFSSCTIITVTHKMEFAMKCDKVLVLSNGEIVEFDRPQSLLEKKGLFYRMVQMSCKKQ